jgi:hypothetical protein
VSTRKRKKEKKKTNPTELRLAGLLLDGRKRVLRVGQAELDDLPDVVLETLVKHAVRLVKNQPRDLGQVEVAFVRKVEDTTGSTNDNPGLVVADDADLFRLRNTTVDADGGDGRGEGLRDEVEVGVRLHGEFTGRGNDEDGDGSVLVLLAGGDREDVLDGGNTESDGLTGTVKRKKDEEKTLLLVKREAKATHPVSATPITSRPPIINGKEALWIGVGFEKPLNPLRTPS